MYTKSNGALYWHSTALAIWTAILKMDKQTLKHKGPVCDDGCFDDSPSVEISHEHADPLQPTALTAVSGAVSWSPLQFPALCLVVGVWLAPMWPLPFLLPLDLFRPLTAPRLHSEEGANTVLLRHRAAEVDDSTLVRALVWRLDTGETELVGDVAAGHFYHLMGTQYDVLLFEAIW